MITKVIGKQKALGVGRPDFSKEISRGVSISGYRFEEEEIPLWFAILCVATPGPSVCTRGPLLAGETVFAPDCSTGFDHAVIPAGYDVLVKEIWLNFNQDVYFEEYQGGTYDDISCLATIPAGAKPINMLQQGWTRSILEDISVPSIWRVSVTNISSQPALGKCWVLCMIKKGAYLWL